MSLRGKPLELIQENDLVALVDNEVLEQKYLEYKQSLPGNSDSEKKEFLADVSSFANAAGGDLIYGIRQEHGIPKELCGVGNVNIDDEKLRLENIIRHGIQPRIHALSISPVKLEKKRAAFIMRVPRSWSPPHRVIFKGHDKFYSRNSAGKYPMDVSELRAAFLFSETTMERIRNFREGRLARIVAGETPVTLYDAAKIVLHIVPIGAFDPAAKVDLAAVAQRGDELDPIGSSSAHYRHNFDGFLTYDDFEQAVAVSYLQVFRNGSIEAVDAYALRERPDGRLIFGALFEKKLVGAVARYLPVQKALGVEPPVVVMLSLLGVSGYVVVAAERRLPRIILEDIPPIDRDTLLVPEVIEERFDCAPHEVMKPIFDAVWRASGYPRSLNYGEDGKWKLRLE